MGCVHAVWCWEDRPGGERKREERGGKREEEEGGGGKEGRREGGINKVKISQNNSFIISFMSLIWL